MLHAISIGNVAVNNIDTNDPLRRYKTAMRMGALIPYGMGMALRRSLWRLHGVTSVLFSERLRQLDTLISALPDSHDRKIALRRHLECNLAMSWRLQALSRCSDAEFSRWVQIDGLERIEAARSQGRGIVLANSHYGSGKTILVILARLGYKIHSFDRRDIFAMLGIREAQRIHSIGLGDRQNSFFLKQVFQASKVLRNGGILHVAIDGFKGKSGRDYNFLGRKRTFPASFAELALQNNAVVLPVFSPLDDDGKIRLQILPELDSGVEEASRDEKVGCLIEQCAELLAARWAQDPGSVHENDLSIYCALPRAGKPEIDGLIAPGAAQA